MTEQGGSVIKVLHFPEGALPRAVEISVDDLDAWQDLVDGNLESMRLKDGLTLMCNEDGVRLEMETNRLVPPAVSGWFDPWRSAIRGPFFIMNDDETSLSQDQIDRVVHAFGETLEVIDEAE